MVGYGSLQRLLLGRNVAACIAAIASAARVIFQARPWLPRGLSYSAGGSQLRRLLHKDLLFPFFLSSSPLFHLPRTCNPGTVDGSLARGALDPFALRQST